MPSHRKTTHRQALLIGYYLKQELHTEPTTENIEQIINEHPNLEELTNLLEMSLKPEQRLTFEQELENIAKSGEK